MFLPIIGFTSSLNCSPNWLHNSNHGKLRTSATGGTGGRMKSKLVEDLIINVCCGAAGAVLSAKGRITIDTSPALRDRLVAILRRPVPALTIDLINVPY